jgi:hypothetical protein
MTAHHVFARSAIRSSLPRALAAASLALAMTSSTSAWADGPAPAPAPAPASAPAPAPAPGFERQESAKQYTAPLSQTTQPSYVPQSVALSGPQELDYHDGEAVPPGYTPVERRRKGPIIAGAVVFGSLYLLSSFSASVSADSSGGGKNELAALYVPIVGPFIQMGKTDSATGIYALLIDGLGQAGGAAFLLWGLTSPKTILVRNDLTGAKRTIRPVPIMTGSTTGVGVVGTF